VVVIANSAEHLFAPRVGDELAAALAARRTLRDQIARLEGQLAEAVVAAFPHATITAEDTRIVARGRGPRLLDLGELEVLRDDLAGQLKTARTRMASRSAAQEDARMLLESMLLAPGKHKFAKVANSALGERGCGVWMVRPRLGLVGMLMGWWEVKLSSGCPLRADVGRVVPA
jgi:hypothetical protein